MPAALWKRLNVSKEELREILLMLYWNQNMSQAQIANKLNCDTTCIENWFSRFELETRSCQEAIRNTKRRVYEITAKEYDTLMGLLLSDLHIEKGHFQSRASFGFKHKEFANAVINATKTFQWSIPKYNKRSLGWHSKTKHCTNLNNERFRWYPNNKKIVPCDIEINPTVLLWWYLGDGYLTKYGAVLCTDSFSRKENEHLVSLINSEGIPSHLTPRNRIRIEGSKGFNKLIDYIGSSPVECYKYKWGER